MIIILFNEIIGLYIKRNRLEFAKMESKVESRNFLFWAKINGLDTRLSVSEPVKSWILACALSVIAETHIMDWVLSTFIVNTEDDSVLVNILKKKIELKLFLKTNKKKNARKNGKFSVKDRKKFSEQISKYEKYPLLHFDKKDIVKLTSIYFMLYSAKSLKETFKEHDFNKIINFINFKITRAHLLLSKKCVCRHYHNVCEKECCYDKQNFFCNNIDNMFNHVSKLELNRLETIMDSIEPKYYRHYFIDQETNEHWVNNTLVPYYNCSIDDEMYFEVDLCNPMV